MDSPDLYRVMFVATFELEDAHAADQTLHTVILAADRARQAHPFDADTDSLELATKTWAIWHGLVQLVATGPLSRETPDYGVSMLTALFVSTGDEQARCRASVKRDWVHDQPALGPP